MLKDLPDLHKAHKLIRWIVININCMGGNPIDKVPTALHNYTDCMIVLKSCTFTQILTNFLQPYKS